MRCGCSPVRWPARGVATAKLVVVLPLNTSSDCRNPNTKPLRNVRGQSHATGIVFMHSS